MTRDEIETRVRSVLRGELPRGAISSIIERTPTKEEKEFLDAYAAPQSASKLKEELPTDIDEVESIVDSLVTAFGVSFYGVDAANLKTITDLVDLVVSKNPK